MFNFKLLKVQAILFVFILLSFSGCRKIKSNPNSLQPEPQIPNFLISSVRTINGSGENNLVVDSNNNVVYANIDAGTIEKVDPNGNLSTFATYGAAGGFANITIDANDYLYVSSPQGLIKITPQGEASMIVTNLPNENIAFPSIAVDSTGNVFYIESTREYVGTNRIFKVQPNGIVSLFVGSGEEGANNSQGISASFNNPRSIVIDNDDNLYVADIGNYLIRKIDPLATVTTFIGSGARGTENGSGTSANIYCSSDLCKLAIDSSDNIYVGDMAGSTGYIKKITPSAKVLTYCGNGSSENINQIGSTCEQSGIWINGGLAIGPNGILKYVAGSTLYELIQ